MIDVSLFAQMNVDVLHNKIDRLPGLGEEVFSKELKITLGGGPMVIPITLHRLGLDVQLGTFMGDDFASTLAKGLLEEFSFDAYTDFKIEGIESPTVLTSVLSFEEDRSFVCYNQNARESHLNQEVVYDFLKDSKVIFAPIGHLEVTKRLHDKGTKVVFDIGWDDNLDVKNFKELLSHVDIFTPNAKEAMKMTKTASPSQALQVLSRYVKHAIVKVGEDGCLLMDNQQVVNVKMPRKFQAIDTTGAGDNFLTGIVYGLVRDYSIIDCARCGNIFGGVSTETLGCYNDIISIAIIEALMA